MSAVTLCERCGAELPLEARFCPRCGAPVAPITTEERKVVSVLFADLAGSTRLAGQLDPERYREVMGAFYTTVARELESLRGRAEKFVGDAVMAVWGIPQAHDDDALRAVRAGLLIRDRTARLGRELGLPVPLRVRVGINSGAVAAGSGPADQFLVSGPAVNLAARLQEAAEPDEVLVGETTWQLTRYQVEYGEPRTVPAKGFRDPVAAWPVVGLSPRSSRRTIPLVDRRRELSLLVDAFERMRETGRAHLVTVLGEPGIGKSRLVDEFVAGLPEGVRVLAGRASEFEEDVTFAPLADLIRRELGVDRGTPGPEVRKRLVELVQRCCDPPELDRVVARLGLALGLGGEGAGADPEQFWTEGLARFEEYAEGDGGERRRFRRAEVRAGVLELLEGLARAGPVVMVLEDLQLAQPELLELTEQVLRSARRLPLLVVCVARDSLLQVRPGWGGGLPDAVTIRLDPLTDREATELAKAAGDSISDDTARRIVELAGGNPFFIIETTGMLLQQHLEHDLGALHGHLLPPTVQAVVASRIDHLAEPARDLLRKASVFPRSAFSADELALITEPDQEVLQELEAAELLERDPERPGVWRFRHDLLRRVAYDSLPKRERQRLHLRAAEGIQERGADRFPQSVAYHLEQAARASLDLDPGDRSLAGRAVQALRRAGDIARRRMELRPAIDLYERALVLAGPAEGWGEGEAKILAGLGEARYWLGEYEAARVSLTRALRYGGNSAWVRAHAARFLGDIALNVEADVGQAAELFGQALEAARELDDPWTIARTLLMAGWAPYWRADLEGARATFQEALEVARKNPEGDPWAEARALTSLNSVTSAAGSERDALALAEEALALGRKMEDPFTVAVAQEIAGNSLRRMMRLEEALASLEESVRNFRDLGARWELASALGDRGYVHRLAGRLEEARRDLQEALDLCTELGERSLIAWTAGELALVLLGLGERVRARKVLENTGMLGTVEPGSRSTLLQAQAVVALLEGDRERARELAEQSILAAEPPAWRNGVAACVWWVGRLFGPEVAGGPEAVEDARRTLEAAGWRHALAEPDLVAGLLQAAS